MGAIYTRSNYNAPSLGANMARQSRVPEVFLHHTVNSGAQFVNTKAEQTAAVRVIDQQHRNKGWSMGGYHWVVFQYTGSRRYARAFALRPASYVPSAQYHHNSNTLAICVYGDGRTDTLHSDTIETIARVINLYKTPRVIRPHSAVYATECPGPKFRAKIPVIARAAGIQYG